MDNNEIKQMRKVILPKIKIAEEKLDNASLLIERDAPMDAIPILFKAADIAVQMLLAFKNKTTSHYQKNIKSLEELYKKEGLCKENTIELLLSLPKMNESYKSKIMLDYDDNVIKSLFKKTENFLGITKKFLKYGLTTSEERMRKKRVKRIMVVSSISFGVIIVIFMLVKLGLNKFGPNHGLLAHYYNNINLTGPAALEKIDKKIDFNWGFSNPHPKIIGEFSVRWEGRIKIDKNDNYTFYIMSDEGVKLFLDDKIIINTWLSKSRQMKNSGSLYLKKGFHNIKVEYFFNQRHANIELLWSSSSFKKKKVISKVLYPPLRLNNP